MRKGFFVYFLVVLPLLGFAQFSDSLTHRVSVAASGNINRTNTGTAYLLTNEARFGVRKKRTTMNSMVNWIYGEVQNNLTNNDFTTTHDVNLYNRNGNFYYWGLANYVSSFSLKINRQLQSGLGVAYNFIDRPEAWLNLSNGLIYETSNITLTDGARDTYQTVRNSLRLSYRFVVAEVITFEGSNFLQNSLNNSSDFIIRSRNSAGIKLKKWLSFSASLGYNQISRTRRENLQFTYGIMLEKYF